MCVKIKLPELRLARGIDRLSRDGMVHHRHYIMFHKPYGVLSRFSPEAGWESLKSFGPFPPRVYPVGRLDVDSEGLLLLTDDNEVKDRLTAPRFGHPRTYLVQVERIPTEEALQQLRSGILLDGTMTREAGVRRLEVEPRLRPRAVPIRFRKNVKTCWLEIVLREGRNRQVRRMTAAVGHPALRLVRTGIGPLHLAGLRPGGCRELSGGELRALRSSLNLQTPR